MYSLTRPSRRHFYDKDTGFKTSDCREFLVFLTSNGVVADAATNSGKCAKVGQVKVVKKVKYVCVKTGSKTVWQVRSSNTNSGSSASSKSQTFLPRLSPPMDWPVVKYKSEASIARHIQTVHMLPFHGDQLQASAILE